MSSLKTTLVVLIIALSNLGWASTYVKDLEILCQSLERVYPAFPIKEKQLGLTKEKFKRTCELEKKRELTDPSLTPVAFFTKVLKLVDAFHDGHIMVFPNGDFTPQHTGVAFTLHNQKVIVSQNHNQDSKVEVGDELMSLNGKSPDELHFLPTRLNRPDYEILSKITGLTVLFPLLQPTAPTLSGRFLSLKTGRVYQETLTYRKGRPPFLPDQHTKLKFVDKGETAIWAIHSFSMRAKESLLADLSQITSSKKVKKIILDLRKNVGGTTEVGNSLLRLFFPETEKFSFEFQFSCDPLVREAMAENPIFTEKFSAGCRGRKSGELSELVYMDPASDEDPDFDSYRSSQLEEAEVSVLISPFSYSTTEDFTMFMKTKKRGLVYGQPSGGGGLIPFVSRRLPSLEAEILIPTFNLFYGIENGKESLEGRGVTPDILCEPILTDITGETDVCLGVVL